MFTKWLTVTNDDHIKKSAKTNETKAQWFDAILMTHKRGMTNQLVCIKPSCRIFYNNFPGNLARGGQILGGGHVSCDTGISLKYYDILTIIVRY